MNMIMILIVFHQLAFLHVNCARKSNRDPEIEHWWLNEVLIKWESPQEPTEHYSREVRLIRYDNSFRLDTLKDDNDDDRKVIACLKGEELHAFLDGELYAINEHPHRVIRMTLVRAKKARKFQRFFEPTPFEHTFEVLKTYYISELITSDGLTQQHHKDDAAHDTEPITLTVYAGLDSVGNETHDRRFIISGGDHDQLFAVFNRDEFISIRKGSNNRLVFAVRPPGRFSGKYFYSMKILFFRDDTPEDFMGEMNQYTSFRPAPPEASTSLVENL